MGRGSAGSSSDLGVEGSITSEQVDGTHEHGTPLLRQRGARNAYSGPSWTPIPGIVDGDSGHILEHPNPDRYAGQHIFVVRREDYVCLVPFVEDEHTVFLKTIIPSRKATKQYLGEESDHED